MSWIFPARSRIFSSSAIGGLFFGQPASCAYRPDPSMPFCNGPDCERMVRELRAAFAPPPPPPVPLLERIQNLCSMIIPSVGLMLSELWFLTDFNTYANLSLGSVLNLTELNYRNNIHPTNPKSFLTLEGAHVGRLRIAFYMSLGFIALAIKEAKSLSQVTERSLLIFSYRNGLGIMDLVLVPAKIFNVALYFGLMYGTARGSSLLAHFLYGKEPSPEELPRPPASGSALPQRIPRVDSSSRSALSIAPIDRVEVARRELWPCMEFPFPKSEYFEIDYALKREPVEEWLLFLLGLKIFFTMTNLASTPFDSFAHFRANAIMSLLSMAIDFSSMGEITSHYWIVFSLMDLKGENRKMLVDPDNRQIKSINNYVCIDPQKLLNTTTTSYSLVRGPWESISGAFCRQCGRDGNRVEDGRHVMRSSPTDVIAYVKGREPSTYHSFHLDCLIRALSVNFCAQLETSIRNPRLREAVPGAPHVIKIVYPDYLCPPVLKYHDAHDGRSKYFPLHIRIGCVMGEKLSYETLWDYQPPPPPPNHVPDQ